MKQGARFLHDQVMRAAVLWEGMGAQRILASRASACPVLSCPVLSWSEAGRNSLPSCGRTLAAGHPLRRLGSAALGQELTALESK